MRWVLLLLCITLSSQEYTDLAWWQTSIVYQIYPRSFQDSNGDGVGDLQGIISRLDYIKSLYVDTIWLSPIYTSPMADFGYDVADYENIDPVFGTLEDFDHLVQEVHTRKMKIIMDFVPNHSSNEHSWFRASETGSGPYKDFYIWHDGKVGSDGSRSPPNNWLSVFGGSAWTWEDSRQQYYLHQFTPEQPDLNYRNPQVQHAMKDVLHFWLRRGVDGFRVDAINTLFEVSDLSLDEPRSNEEGITSIEHEYLDHIHTLFQPEIHDVIRGWADVIFDHGKEEDKDIFTVMEVYDPTLVYAMEYYHSGADMPFNFGLIFVNQTCGGSCFKDIINRWMKMMPKGKWPNFVIGNHDNRRISTRKGAKYINVLNMMLLTLPGTPTTYYGEEIGMLDIPLPSYKDNQDPWGTRLGPELYGKYTRDPCRSPMQWDSSLNAGFSVAGKTWLPVHENYPEVNVEAQEENLQSPLEIYRDTAQLRQNKAFQNNKLTFHVVNDNILSYIRWAGGERAFLVILNLGRDKATHEYSFPLGDEKVKVGTILVASGNFKEADNMRPFHIIPLSNLSLDPGQGLVLQIKLMDKNLQSEYKDEL